MTRRADIALVTRFTRLAVASFIAAAAIAALSATGALGQPEPASPSAAGNSAMAVHFEPAPLMVWNRRIALFRAPYGALSPADRARSAQRRIEELPLDLLKDDATLLETTSESVRGVLVMGAGATLFGLLDADLDRSRTKLWRAQVIRRSARCANCSTPGSSSIAC